LLSKREKEKNQQNDLGNFLLKHLSNLAFEVVTVKTDTLIVRDVNTGAEQEVDKKDVLSIVKTTNNNSDKSL